MATIKDVAKKANVAVSTVSYVINDTKNVTPETKQRILAAIKELNYKPNIVAQSLKTKKTLTIGILVPEINAFFSEVIEGIEHIADQNGYSVILCNTQENQEKENRYLNTLLNKNIDGLIIVGTCKNQHVLTNISETPIVIVDRKLGNSFASVMVDNKKSGYLATNYLLEKKLSDILLLTGPLTISTYFDRMSGYVEALQVKGMEYNELLIQECPVSYFGGYKAVKEILENKVININSIFAANDVIAIGAVKALIEEQYSIPDDISIIGHGDIPISSVYIPSLSTVRQPKLKMGEAAANLLFEQINSGIKKTDHIILEPELILRETTI